MANRDTAQYSDSSCYYILYLEQQAFNAISVREITGGLGKFGEMHAARVISHERNGPQACTRTLNVFRIRETGRWSDSFSRIFTPLEMRLYLETLCAVAVTYNFALHTIILSYFDKIKFEYKILSLNYKIYYIFSC